jgi:hypothetical protein
MGVVVDGDAIVALNPTLDLTTAPINTLIRIRAAWTPVVRVIEPAGSISTPSGTLSWRGPASVWTGPAAAALPSLLIREWNGDGIADLFLVAAGSSAGTTLTRLAYQNGQLVSVEAISRPYAVSGWSIR